MIKVSSAASADIFENSFGLQTEDLHSLRQTYATNLQKTFRLPYHIHRSKSLMMRQKAEACQSEKLSWQSLEAARQSLICDPSNTRARKIMAYSLQDIGCGDEALNQYRMAIGEEKRRKSLTTQSNTTRFVNEKGFGVLDMMNNNHGLRQTIMGDAPQSQALVKRLNGLRSHKPVNFGKPVSKLLRVAVSILLFVAFTPFLQAQPGSITISGQVTSLPHQLPPQTTIIAKDPDTQETLAQTQTDENGYYSLEILTTHTGHITSSEAVFSLHPNPFGSHATLVASLPTAGSYTLAAYDLFGRMIISETLQTQPGLNHIPVALPPAEGLVIVTLQGKNFRKTLKALQNNEQGQYENRNYALNDCLIQNIETQQNQTINWHNFTGNDYFDAENQGYGSPVGHDRSAGFDYRHNGFDPGTQGSEMYGSETEQYLTILFSSDNHEQKDTTVTFTYHEINKVLNQIPETVNSTYNLYVFDDQGSVEEANVSVYNVETPRRNNQRTNNERVNNQRRNNPLFSGITNNQGEFAQEYEVQEWTWPGQPTIRNVENLHTVIESDPHEPYQRTDTYQQNLNIDAELQRLTGQEPATIQINLTNTPMNQNVTNAPITVTNEHDDEVGHGYTDSNGQLLLELLRGYEVQGNDTIYDYENLIFNVSRTHHEDKTFTKTFDDHELEKVLQQIKYESTATLNIQLTSQPLGFNPSNINISASYNEQELSNAEMINGEANLGIDYEYYISNTDTLRLINQEPITQPLIIQATSETHEDKNFQKEFAQNMTITSDLQQIPQQKNAYIHGEVTEQGTNQALEGVDVTLKEAQDQNYEETQTTNTNQQGQYEFNMTYTEYMNPNDPEDYLREPSHIKLKFEKNTYNPVTTAPKETQTQIQHNQELESLLQEYQITIMPYTFDNAHMEEVLNEPYTLHIRNTTTNQVTTTQQTGTQPLQITLQGQPNDELKIWHNHEDLAEYIVIEHPHQEWTDPNIGNNNPTRLWNHTQPFDTLTVTLNNLVNHQYDLNTPLELYTPRYWYNVSGYGGGGETVYFNGPIVTTMLGSRPPGSRIKNWKYEEHVDMMFINWRVIQGDFWNNSNPISQENLDRMMNIAENVINHTYSASGRERLPVQYHIVNSQQDSIVQEAYDRDWERTSMTRIQFGTPNNSMFWDSVNVRIKYGTAQFGENEGQGAIQEEIFEHMFGVRDPVVGSSTAYIATTTDEGFITLNTLGHTMATVSASADVGTVFLPANTTNNKNFNYETKK